MSINRDIYKNFCKNETSIPLFSQYWWLQAVADNEWDVCIVEDNGVIEATMPYCIQSRMGFKLLTQPKLTQTMGPWLRSSASDSQHKILSREKCLHENLIQQLPNFAFFRQNWNYLNQNWMAFYQNGFKQTTRYTYRFNDIDNVDLIWKGMRKNIKSDINKAKKKYKLVVNKDSNIEDFIALYKQTFERQKKDAPYKEGDIFKLYKECKKNDKCKIFIAQDNDGCNYAGSFLVWDDSTIYYLLGGSDNKYRSTGAISLCIWEAINFAQKENKSFDFEGSMIPSISKYFRAFGAEQVPYFTLSKSNSKIVNVINFFLAR